MSPFLFYIARAGLYLSLFYAFYLLVMRGTTFFRLNRALLLAGGYLCLILPFIRLRTVTVTVMASELTLAGGGAEAAEQTIQPGFPWNGILLVLFISGAIVTLTLHLISTWKMHQLLRSGESSVREGCRLVLLNQDIPSFSWGHTVAMSRKDWQEYPAIFTHERMHVKYRHSLDMVLLLPIQLLFWWNPLVWIIREELRLLHEYQADEGVLQNGIDATQYQLLLVRKAVGEQRFSLASGFQHTKLKNRIAMMVKPSSSLWMRWSYLALIPVLAAFMFACNPSAKSKNQTSEAVPFQLMDEKPKFNGGDAQSFSQWVNDQLHYPEQAFKDGAQGRVTLQFTVGTDGVVRDVKVLRGVREDLDAEAVRVISTSPKWEPGKKDGKEVPVIYTFPVIYTIK